MNATIGSKQQWRSVQSIRLYVNAKEAGERYQQALAARAAELGYAVVPSRNGTFELDGVPRDVALLFSSRAKAVEDRLAEQGLTRARATGLQREEAALRTRGAKPEIDRVLQRSQDRALARQHGLDLERFVAEAKERSQTLERVARAGPGACACTVLLATEPALRAVREAAAILTERDAAFTARSLEQRARQMSLGTARAEQIEQAVAQLQSRGELVERQVRAIDPVTRQPTLLPGYTTAAMIQTERRMLALEQAGRGAVDRFMHRLDAQALVGSARALAEERGFGWTHGQAEATKGVLTTSARVLGIQGYAGTAKTTTVLATVAEAARQQGYTVKGMAPTTEATLGLAQAIGGEAVTVQRQVAELERGTEGRGSGSAAGKQLWIVDEASLVGARAMHTLLAGATLQGARVLLVGDEQQLGSVEAGRAFAQLQEAGMPTFRLTEIVRQSNAATKEAVYAALQADAAKALQAIERGGGEVVEIQGKSHDEDAHDRRAFLARRYAGLTPEERARTVLADPSRAGRQELNEQVREALQARGELQGPQLTLDILVPKGLTPGEQKQPVFYGRGDVVSFRRELAPRQQDRLEKDTLYRVAGIDQHGGRLQLQKDDGSFVIWRPGSCGARDAEVYTARAAPARRRRPHHLDQEPAGDRRRQRPDGHRHRGASGQGQLHRRASWSPDHAGGQLGRGPPPRARLRADGAEAAGPDRRAGAAPCRALAAEPHQPAQLLRAALARQGRGDHRHQRPGRPDRRHPRALGRAAGSLGPARGQAGTGDRPGRNAGGHAGTRTATPAGT